MKETVTRALQRAQQTFRAFTAGQKTVAVIGTVALLLAGFLVFRWAATPSYAPLYTNLAGADASAVIDDLNSKNVPYKITDGGNTIMVPESQVYSTRIALSGDGLPGDSSSGYSILDSQGLSTSDFQEQTNFKRAMEAELARTIEAIDGVRTAVVHLALPEKQVFADHQEAPTASVLVDMQGGRTLDAGQVQAVVNLVASSIDGLKPGNVTITDSTGKLLSAAGADAAGIADNHAQQVADYESRLDRKVQQMLDRVLGPGNASVQVTAVLDFDKAVTDKTHYSPDPKMPALSASTSTEKYNGTGAGGITGGVVGPDGQMDPSTAAGSNGKYLKKVRSSDNAVDKTVEHRVSSPGSVKSLHVGAVVDTQAAKTTSPTQLRDLIAATLGINPSRGDTVDVSTMPFNRTPEKQAAAELAQQQKAEATAQRNTLLRNAGLGLVVALVGLVTWLRSRKRAKARQQATTYVVEQLRRDAADRVAAQQLETSPAMAALEERERDLTQETRDEIAALVERQPEDVAALLRGWLVDRV